LDPQKGRDRVPVVTPFARHYPFLLEGDTLSLSSGFTMKGAILYDVPLKAMHHIRPPGEKIIQALREGCSCNDLRRIAKDSSVTDQQLNELLGFLNMIGGLRYTRNLAQHANAMRIKSIHLLFGTRYRPLAWRQPASPGWLLVGVLRATWPVIFASVVVGTVAASAGLLPVYTVFGLGIFGVLTFLCSLIIHELAHVSIARKYAARPHILQAGLRLGIIHRRLQPREEAQSSLAGPLAGSGVGLLAAIPAMAAGADSYALLGGAISLFHSLSLLPWYGDGISFHKALRQLRASR
jgi:hypothetical protein